jgi:hypothetical protein
MKLVAKGFEIQHFSPHHDGTVAMQVVTITLYRNARFR